MKVPPIRLMPETEAPRPRVNGTAEINFIIDETGRGAACPRSSLPPTGTRR